MAEPRVVGVTWHDVSDQFGRHRTVPVFSRSSEDFPPDRIRITYRDPAEIVAQDDRWRLARASHDTAAIDRLLSGRFVETDQEGKSRNRAEALAIWAKEGSSALVVDKATIRISDNVATMTGEQVERSATGAERLSFQRVYVRVMPEEWKLLSNIQFKTPVGAPR
jgi:hypothetical protein